ncbi:hypothetical protein THAOC_23530, partial [Thalassiosira oceanica]
MTKDYATELAPRSRHACPPPSSRSTAHASAVSSSSSTSVTGYPLSDTAGDQSDLRQGQPSQFDSKHPLTRKAGTTAVDLRFSAYLDWSAANPDVCPSFLPTKACNRTVALSRTNLVDRTLAQANGRGPSTRQGAQLDEAGQHSSPLCWPGRVSIVAKCAPEGVPSGHEEGEARQLKTNPPGSYPTK